MAAGASPTRAEVRVESQNDAPPGMRLVLKTAPSSTSLSALLYRSQQPGRESRRARVRFQFWAAAAHHARVQRDTTASERSSEREEQARKRGEWLATRR